MGNGAGSTQGKRREMLFEVAVAMERLGAELSPGPGLLWRWGGAPAFGHSRVLVRAEGSLSQR